jgi:hypothetical protein
MYHPAFILRTPTLEMKRIYGDDFRKIPALLDEARKKQMAVANAPAPARVLDQLPLF